MSAFHIAEGGRWALALALANRSLTSGVPSAFASDFGIVTRTKLASDFGGAYPSPQNDLRLDGEPCPALMALR